MKYYNYPGKGSHCSSIKNRSYIFNLHIFAVRIITPSNNYHRNNIEVFSIIHIINIINLCTKYNVRPIYICLLKYFQITWTMYDLWSSWTIKMKWTVCNSFILKRKQSNSKAEQKFKRPTLFSLKIFFAGLPSPNTVCFILNCIIFYRKKREIFMHFSLEIL